jgi:hypothetical protein
VEAPTLLTPLAFVEAQLEHAYDARTTLRERIGDLERDLYLARQEKARLDLEINGWETVQRALANG